MNGHEAYTRSALSVLEEPWAANQFPCARADPIGSVPSLGCISVWGHTRGPASRRRVPQHFKMHRILHPWRLESQRAASHVVG